MKFNFKKITSVLASVVMLGSTLGIAAAATNYPAPFVSGGASDVAVVVGANAASSDYLAAVDVGQSLQAELAKQTATGTTTSATATGESVLFETGTNKLNIGDNLTTVKPVAIDEDEMPTILAKGTYSNEENEDFDYTQKLEFDARLQLSHFADSEYMKKKPTVGIRVAKNAAVANYTLDFTEQAEDDGGTGSWTDFEDTSINMLGMTYEIVDAKNTTNNRPYLVLMRGAVKDTLNYQESKTYTLNGKDYLVEVSYVDSDECKFNVNGEATNKLQNGEISKISDGTKIGVTEVDYSTGAVTEIMRCSFYLGADKIELDDAQEVKINDEAVGKLYSYITATYSTSIAKLDKIVIEWIADDDLFLTEGKELVMPGLESFKFQSGALTIPTEEEITIEGSDDHTIGLKIPIESGTASIDVLSGNVSTSVGFFTKIGGEDDGEGLCTMNSSGNAAVEMVYDLGSNFSGHQYFVATYWDGSASGESYLLEITDSEDGSSSDYGVDFRNVLDTTQTWTNVANTSVKTAGRGSFSVGDITVYVNGFIEDSWVNLSTGASVYFDRIISKEGLMVYLPVQNASDNAKILDVGAPFIDTTPGNTTWIFWMREEDKDGKLAAGDDVNVTVGFTSANKTQAGPLTQAETVMSVSGGTPGDYEDPDDDNMYIGWVESDLATKTMYDTDPDEDTVKLIYHGNQVYGNIFVAETDSVVSASGSSTTGVTELGSVTVEDSEVSSVQGKNLVVVGGSCINRVAAKILGGAYCTADFTTNTGVGANQFLVKVVESPYTTGKVAMLVAGYEAADTTKAVEYVTKEAPATDVGTTLKKVTATYADVA